MAFNTIEVQIKYEKYNVKKNNIKKLCLYSTISQNFNTKTLKTKKILENFKPVKRSIDWTDHRTGVSTFRSPRSLVLTYSPPIRLRIKIMIKIMINKNDNTKLHDDNHNNDSNNMNKNNDYGNNYGINYYKNSHNSHNNYSNNK